jgi:hypothetical protein
LHGGAVAVKARPRPDTLDGTATPPAIGHKQCDRATLIDLFEVGEQGAVLARPDGHTAWRTSDPAGIAAADLTRVLREFGIGASIPIGSPR